MNPSHVFLSEPAQLRYAPGPQVPSHVFAFLLGFMACECLLLLTGLLASIITRA